MRSLKWFVIAALVGTLGASAGCDKKGEVETEVVAPGEEGAAVEGEEALPETQPAAAAEEEAGEAPMEMAGAAAVIRNKDGEPMGAVLFNKTPTGLKINARITNIEPGAHGFHVHENGVCDPPDFKSAGGHFAPEESPHGGPADTPDKRHTGDFGNLKVEANGVGNYERVDKHATLEEGPKNIVGKAVIVHATADDLESQPSGAAGPRIGCGIITTDAAEIRSAMALAMNKPMGAAPPAEEGGAAAPTTQPAE